MLVLRKEVKLGLGVGAAGLGIAAVYGLMAVLSANSHTPSQATATDEPAAVVSPGEKSDVTPAPSKDPSAVTGLPPKEDAIDPFAESHRKDGNASDPWEAALKTGKVQTVLAVTPVPADVSQSTHDNGASNTSIVQNPTNISDVIKTQAPTNATAAGSGTRSGAATGSAKLPSHEGSTETASAAGSGTYTVLPGDTFTRIAAKLYGDRRLASALIKANPNIEPTRLRSGVAIVVPAKEEVASLRGSAAPEAVRTTGAVDASREYRVVAGDTLHRIAVKLYKRNAMWEAIYDENKAEIGNDPGKLKVGEVLKLPKAPTASA